MATNPVLENGVPRTGKPQRGIHAMEVGGALLQTIANAGRPVSMLDLSVAANLPLNQVFTYMVSLVRTGLVRKDATTHCFEPGPLALRLGLTALRQVSPLQESLTQVKQLVVSERHAVFVAIWTDHGPTVIQYDGPDMYLHVGLHVGSVMSVAHSSTGRLFSAFLPRQSTRPMLLRELGASEDGIQELELDAILADVRRHGVSRTYGLPIPEVDSLSAPIFDATGAIILAVTVFGSSSSLDTSDHGKVRDRLLEFSRRLSRSGPRDKAPLAISTDSAESCRY
ncbi:DNA-binding IclR family transcriptional regulator [Paraburkholderia atlantica]|uniref:IclR family transcriptional regulator n=1 Tax=Paraburkholderia atlantica TaxID=2654982 RepID=UPI003D1A7B00